MPTRVLLEQWRRAIAEVYPERIGCYGDGARLAAPVTVATYESAYRHMDRLGNRFGLLVVDEAHHFGGGVRDEALAGFRRGELRALVSARVLNEGLDVPDADVAVVVVVLSAEEFRHLTQSKPDFKTFLLSGLDLSALELERAGDLPRDFEP